MRAWLLGICVGLLATGLVLSAPELAGSQVLASAAGGEHGGGDHGASNPLSPGRDLGLWSIVTFVLFILVLWVMAWGPLQDGLGKREANIRADIANAEAARVKAEQLLKDYEAKLAQVQEQVREILAEARRDADVTKADILATAQKEAELTKQRAILEISRAKDGALSELFDFVTSNVIQATERVVGRSLTGDDQQRLVQNALAEMNIRKN